MTMPSREMILWQSCLNVMPAYAWKRFFIKWPSGEWRCIFGDWVPDTTAVRAEFAKLEAYYAAMQEPDPLPIEVSIRVMEMGR